MERIPEEVLQAYEVSESYQKLKKIRNDNSKNIAGDIIENIKRQLK